MKITLNGEVHEYDGSRPKVSEALLIEEAYGRRYVEWQDDLSSGGAKAMCTLAWFIWRQAGRDVALKDILDDTVPLDLHEMLQSVVESGMAEAAAAAAEAEAAAAVPTQAGSDPAGTPTTGTGTSSSSPASSASARGKSASSKSRTSKP